MVRRMGNGKKMIWRGGVIPVIGGGPVNLFLKDVKSIAK